MAAAGEKPMAVGITPHRQARPPPCADRSSGVRTDVLIFDAKGTLDDSVRADLRLCLPPAIRARRGAGTQRTGVARVACDIAHGAGIGARSLTNPGVASTRSSQTPTGSCSRGSAPASSTQWTYADSGCPPPNPPRCPRTGAHRQRQRGYGHRQTGCAPGPATDHRRRCASGPTPSAYQADAASRRQPGPLSRRAPPIRVAAS
jgi:hypothetical protein